MLPHEVSETSDLFEDQIPHPADGIFFFKGKVEGDFTKGFVGGIMPHSETNNHRKLNASKGFRGDKDILRVF